MIKQQDAVKKKVFIVSHPKNLSCFCIAKEMEMFRAMRFHLLSFYHIDSFLKIHYYKFRMSNANAFSFLLE